MAVTSTVLVQTRAAPTTTTAVYTSSGVTTIIDKFTAVNTSTTTPYTITVYLTDGVTVPADATTVVKTKTLQALETYTFPEIVGHNLSSNGLISVVASNAAITIRSSGRQVS